MVRQLPPRRPYIHSLLTSDFARPLDSEECLGPQEGYVFPKYYRDTTILKMLQKWVTGKLPQTCPVRLLNVHQYYPPTLLLEHYNGTIPYRRPSSDIKPVWFFTHLSKIPCAMDPSRGIAFSSQDGHWIEQDGSTEIKAKDGTVMGSKRKAIYYEANSCTRKCWKTDLRMVEYILARYPGGARSRLSSLIDTKSGEWMVVRISVSRQKNRNACPSQPRLIRHVRRRLR